tara:strand:+ start:216 stop:515 length:300 start_codon:yes stop_codon:yes gene_type:complete
MSNTIDIELIDFLDLLNHTLSNDFTEKWKYKYSEKFIKHFQLKILHTINKGKVLKINTLYLYLTKKCKYSKEQVLNFFKTIDIDIYRPLVSGKLTKDKA